MTPKRHEIERVPVFPAGDDHALLRALAMTIELSFPGIERPCEAVKGPWESPAGQAAGGVNRAPPGGAMEKNRKTTP